MSKDDIRQSFLFVGAIIASVTGAVYLIYQMVYAPCIGAVTDECHKRIDADNSACVLFREHVTMLSDKVDKYHEDDVKVRLINTAMLARISEKLGINH